MRQTSEMYQAAGREAQNVFQARLVRLGEVAGTATLFSAWTVFSVLQVSYLEG